MTNVRTAISPRSENRTTRPIRYRAVLIPEESYQDLRQKDGRDFLIDNMLELTINCDRCRRQHDTLTPDGGKDAAQAAWLCGPCRGGRG